MTRTKKAAVTIVAVFATIVTANVVTGFFPRSTARSAVERMSGPFAQRWNLFAPAPPSANLDLYLVVRDANGHVSAPVNVSALARRVQVRHRFDAPRYSRVFTKLAQHIEAGPTRSDIRRLQYVLSASTTMRNARSVRGFVIRRRAADDAPHPQFHLSDPDAPPARGVRNIGPIALIYDSGWLRYDATAAKVPL